MAERQRGNAVNSIEELAGLLGVSSELLLCLARSADRYYREDEEVKPDGRIRIYNKPYGDLKKVQKIIHRKFIRSIPSHNIIHSYRSNRDQVTNAQIHVGKQLIVKLDIKDFFPSVGPERVFKALRDVNCSEPVARLLTRLCTRQNQLPQGAPTSPGIANQVLMPLARRIERLCSIHHLTPSIFGDDITVSGSKRAQKIKNLLARIIQEEGFCVNKDKIKVLPARVKQVVTGVVVNRKTNVDKDYYRRVRAVVHNCLTKGPATQFEGDLRKAKNSLRGKISHVQKLNPSRGANLLRTFHLISWPS